MNREGVEEGGKERRDEGERRCEERQGEQEEEDNGGWEVEVERKRKERCDG